MSSAGLDEKIRVQRKTGYDMEDIQMTEAPKKALIEIRGFHAYYGDFKALNNINLNIEKNTVTALIGPSGCGKSTLLRTINRINDYTEGFRVEGKLHIDGVNIFEKSVNINRLRAQVGMVFQKPNPFPKSIYDNIAYGLKVQGITSKKIIEERVVKSLHEVYLWDEVKDNLKKNAYGLSGGQQQRLCIARTLAVEPSIILMDEPTSALDPISTAKIEELVFELKKKYTILIVTHNMQQARRVSDFTAFMYLGDLIEYGITAKIFENPELERTKRYILGLFG